MAIPNSFEFLIASILEDDRAKAEELLDQDPELTRRCVAGERYDSRIAHWIYGGDTAMHVAAAGYRVEIARMLLDSRADAGSAKNRRWSQPLHYASDGHLENSLQNAQRQAAMIRLLLNAGSDINAQDKNGATPLHRAVRTRSAEAAKFLMDAGADPTVRNRPGSTPFHLAVQNTGRGGTGSEKARAAQRKILEAFLDRGVSPNITDANGKSVRDWVRSDWIRTILNRGAT